METPSATATVSEQLEQAIDARDAFQLQALLQLLPADEVTWTLGRLDEDQHTRMLSLLPPEIAVTLLEHLDDGHAAELIDDLPAQAAAAIVDEMDSDDQADVLMEMADDDAEAILQEMAPQEAADVRKLVQYEPDTAGGLMITEYLVFDQQQRVEDVIADLRRQRERYAEYDVQYLYVCDEREILTGLVRLRDLLLAPGRAMLAQIMLREPITVAVTDSLGYVEDILDHHPFHALPVLDEDQKLVGVVRREAVNEARGEKAEEALMRFGGIISGEEIRTMSLSSRTLRRLAFLVPNVFLLLASASVIALYEDTVEKVVALAVFLPVVAGLSGCSGNQALAVTIRELSLGLVRPVDVLWVTMREIWTGLLSGLVLAVVLAAGVAVWRQDLVLGLVVGGALPLTVTFAVCVGGVIPLLLSRIKLDPAMASGPLLTTLVDLFSFFMVLLIAATAIGWLT